MRVTCDNLNDFLVNLKDVSAGHIIEGTIYYSITRRQIGEAAHRQEVIFQASAVIETKSGGGEYLLMSGESCGRDLLAQPKDLAGTEHAAELLGKLRDKCVELGVDLKPGIVSE